MKFGFSQDYKEFMIVAIVMTGILLPVRLLFVEYVSNSTWGSLGIISLISVIIVILVKKKKLGYFGRIFERQMLRLTTGKKRIFVATMMTISLLYFSYSVYTIDLANNYYPDEMALALIEVQKEFGVDFANSDTIENVIEPLQADKIVGGMDDYLGALLYDFKIIAITQGVVNELSDGMILHFHLVFLVEQIELMGVYIFYAVTMRKAKEVSA